MYTVLRDNSRQIFEGRQGITINLAYSPPTQPKALAVGLPELAGITGMTGTTGTYKQHNIK